MIFEVGPSGSFRPNLSRHLRGPHLVQTALRYQNAYDSDFVTPPSRMGKPATTRQRRKTVVTSSDDEGAPSTKPSPSKTPPRGKKSQTSSQSVLSSANGSLTNQRAPAAQDGPSSPKRKRPSAPNSPSKKKDQKDEAKPKENLIKSFFDKAAQKQKDRPPKPAKPDPETITIEEEPEIIEDDISDGDDVGFTGAKVKDELAIPFGRKRKLDNLDGKNVLSSSMPNGSQRFRKPSGGSASTPTSSASVKPIDVDLRPWTERFAPINLEELAVHNKKVQDVRNWLASVLRGTESKCLLILKGAAGSGKTTTLQLIAKELGISLHEWRNPGLASSIEEGYTSMTAQFEDFVGRAGRFGALSFDNVKTDPSIERQPDSASGQKEVILVEEFPNTFTRSSSTLQSFRSAVLHFLTSNTPSLNDMFSRQRPQTTKITPIVMIISETLLTTSTAAADSFTAFRLLGPEILNHPGVTVIDFNPIAPTFMTKALELVLRKESRKSGRRKAPGPSVLKHLSELGDVRSAVSSLEFLCLRGDEFDGWSGKITFTKAKGGAYNPAPSKLEKESLEVITQRESTLGIFHAVGKVVYNKREEPTDTPPPQPPSWLPQHKRLKMSEVDTETLLNELGTDIQTFVSALHENYVLSCQETTTEDTLDTINGCIDSLSDSDFLCPDRFARRGFQGVATDALRQDEISFYVSVQGLLFSLPHPVKRIAPPSGVAASGKPLGRGTAYQMLYPRSLQIWRQREEIQESLEKVMHRMYNGNTAASEFANASGTGGVETWAKANRFSGSSSTQRLSDKDLDDSLSTSGLMALGMSNKLELLLETLPYTSAIQKRKRSSTRDPMLKDIETVTRIQAAMVQTDSADHDLDAEVSPDEVWSTDKPSEESVAAYSKSWLGIRMKDGGEAVVVQEKAQPMVLSDDDIEDD